ncbi:MAG TPA: hypothetical protein VKD91_06405, partial [Pyrinomonadaceae bacterium]|nr:hypothetical protein [Pyrinomonadaceae bacterium]
VYLYGRALLLSGKSDEAVEAFGRAINLADTHPSPETATIRKEATLGFAAACLRSGKQAPEASKHLDEIMTAPPHPSGSK